MVFKVVFQIPFDESKWDEEWAREMRVETPGTSLSVGQVIEVRCLH